jgi:hypothetical protein
MQLENLWNRGLLAAKLRLKLPKKVISGENKPSCEGKNKKNEELSCRFTAISNRSNYLGGISRYPIDCKPDAIVELQVKPK